MSRAGFAKVRNLDEEDSPGHTDLLESIASW